VERDTFTVDASVCVCNEAKENKFGCVRVCNARRCNVCFKHNIRRRKLANIRHCNTIHFISIVTMYRPGAVSGGGRALKLVSLAPTFRVCLTGRAVFPATLPGPMGGRRPEQLRQYINYRRRAGPVLSRDRLTQLCV
jgi:hypothetical protein